MAKNDPICVMGDAAHGQWCPQKHDSPRWSASDILIATVPFQASGGGMCVEDTLILSTLLGRSKSREEARSPSDEGWQQV